MSNENDPELWKWAWSLPALLLGWLHIRQNRVEDIANAVSGKLTENYMTRPDVEKKVDGALDEFRNDLTDLKDEMRGQLKELSGDVKYLVRLKIEEGKSKD